MTLTAIKYDEEEHVLSLLDQRALPATTTYIQCTTSHQVAALLPTGRFFGRITQKGPENFLAAGLKVLANFEHKGPKRGRTFKMFVLLFFLKVENPRNFELFTHKNTEKLSFVLQMTSRAGPVVIKQTMSPCSIGQVL
jgi:hypothetical protein